MCPRACVPSVTREARGRPAVLSRPRRRGHEALSAVNVAPVDSALSAQRGFHTHTHTHTAPGRRPWTRERLASEPRLPVPSASPPRRRRLEAAAHVGGRPAASRPRPPSGPCHSSIQIATPLPHTARSPPGSRLVSHHGLDPRALRFGCWSPELWPRGETPPVLTPLCIRPPRGHTRPRTRKLCVERLGPRITPRRRAAPSQDLAWVRNDCPRGRALTGRCGWRSARTRQTS